MVSGWDDAPARTTVDGMEVHRVGGRHSYTLAAPAYYLRHLRGRRFDAVVEDLNKVPLFTPLWARPPAVLLVHHLFGRTAFVDAPLPLAAATWLLERPVPLVYGNTPTQAVSPSTAADLEQRGFSGDRIVTIPNGVDLDKYRTDPDVRRFDEPTILYIGRLKRYKGVHHVLHALSLLRRDGRTIRFIVAGRGDYEAELRRLSHSLDLQDQVEFAGFVDEAEKVRLMRRSWAHVLTSEKEGWGLTNLEAGSCGTPTVASDAPGLRDSVRDGRTGLLVPHGDREALARALWRLVEDRELRERLGGNAREFAKGFGWEEAVDRTEEHLEEVVDGRGRPSRNVVLAPASLQRENP